jgi:subtilisin family serine protease
MTWPAGSAHLRSALAVLATTSALAAMPATAGAAAPRATAPPRDRTGPDLKVPWGSGAARFVPGEVVVVWREGAPAAARRSLASELGAVGGPARRVRDVDVLRFPSERSAAAAMHRLRRSPLVRFAEPDRIAAVLDAPTPPYDPYFASQWALRNTGQQHPITIYDAKGATARKGTPGSDVRALDAWAAQTVHDPVVVAVVDTGVDFSNPDLTAMKWVDPAYPNGGYDFADGDDDPSPRGTSELNSHGTHVAGIIAAQPKNGIGIAGVCPDCRIMALRVGSASGITLGAELKAIDFAIQHGASIINMSFGSPAWSGAERAAIAEAGRAGVLVVAAAGNGSVDNDVPFYLNSSVAAPIYPASYTLSNIVSVAASNDRDEYGYTSQCRSLGLPLYRCAFTNWGHDSVDLAAPGVDVLSTVQHGKGSPRFGGDYEVWDGTSMAAPMVSAVAGLVRSEHPTYSAVAVKNAVMNGVERPRALVLYDAWASITGLPKRALTGNFTVTQGRLDALGALRAPTTNATQRSDGNINGARRLPHGRAAGRVSWPGDANDVYRRRLHAGRRYRVTLEGPRDADLDLWVWRPGTTEIGQFTRGCFFGRSCPALVGESGRQGSHERVEFRARTTGRYYLQVNGWYSGARYRLRLVRL